MYLQGFVILCLAIVPPFLCYGKVPMAVDPILNYLNLDPEYVIEHELVNIDLPERIQKRAIHEREAPIPMSIRAFGHNINLWLHPRDSLLASNNTPVYKAYSNPRILGKVEYVLQRDAMKKVGILLEDRAHLASLVIGSDEIEEPTINGVVKLRGDNAAVIVRSLPGHVVEEHLRKRRSIDDNSDDSSFNSARHVVLKVKDGFLENYNGMMPQKMEERSLSGPIVQAHGDDTSINYSHSIYPKILVVVDFSYYQYRSDDQFAHFLEYVLAFWNGVDLFYRHLENPNIRLVIGAIAISMSTDATPYIANTMIEQNSRFNHRVAIFQAARFFYDVREQIKFTQYNIAVTMTKLNLASPAIGVAYTGGACNIYAQARLKMGVALVHDNGGFVGILTAVHELGHSLGLGHDNGTAYPACDRDFGYIMASSANPTENASTFSSCSLAQFNEVLTHRSLSCLYNPPPLVNYKNLPKLMPGKMQSADDQCRAEGRHGVCPWPRRSICSVLDCLTVFVDDDYKVKYMCQRLFHGAAPGTPCGNKNETTSHFCLQNRCVTL